MQDRTTATTQRETYRRGPSLEGVATGQGSLARGSSGEGVVALQAILNALGASPPLAQDGLFGPKTEAALRSLEARLGRVPGGPCDAGLLTAMLGAVPPDSVSRSDTYQRGALPRAPRAAVPGPDAPPASAIPFQRPPAITLAPPGATPVAAPVSAPVVSGPRDAELAQLQGRGIEAARRELDAGVREDHSRYENNRGPRIDQYAQRGRMSPGGEWCGYFSGFALSEGARSAGQEFAGVTQFHSMQKARAFFEYRSYTNNSRAERQRLDGVQAQHQADGSTRRWMVLSGSGGERHARDNGRPCEVFEPGTLPIRAGDTALFSRGHVGLVESYDATTGRLTTIEGNSIGEAVRRRTYDLNDARDRAAFEGFGRPARGDYVTRGP